MERLYSILEIMKIKDIVRFHSETTTPIPDVVYHLYSLPSFDNNQTREELLGQDIQSNKFTVPNRCILFNKLNVRFKRIWRIDSDEDHKIASTEFLPLIIDENKVDFDYCFYLLASPAITDYLCGQNANTSGSHKRIDPTNFFNIGIKLPPLAQQYEIGKLLSSLDTKIKLNRQINQNLEAMAKQLYDYWFVQFDFPDENGKPYKSSGGKMVWNEKLKREIPIGWKDITFNSFINKNKAGDWGDDIPKDGTIKVGCVRGADIIKLNDVPTRYITSKHSNRLLEDGDIVIEVSGGSPIQATGRVALITNGVIERNGGALVCSNFCQSFSMKKRVFSEYFYYLWKNLYDNDNMFNFEGKTSGIKNFQTEIFLANHWFEVPKQLIETFHAVVSQYHLMIDQNIAESNNLIKLRDELLPLLMNGQVSVNSDLSAH